MLILIIQENKTLEELQKQKAIEIVYQKGKKFYIHRGGFNKYSKDLNKGKHGKIPINVIIKSLNSF